MATNTPKYSFKKPDESDFYSIQDQNGNWDKAESTLVDLDAPTFEDYTGATQVPTPETALAAINSKSKLSLLFSNVKAFLKGAVTIGMIVNNCATDNPNLPVSAAQAKALMDAVTKLNSDWYPYKSNAMLVSPIYQGAINKGICVTSRSQPISLYYYAGIVELFVDDTKIGAIQFKP